MNPPTSRMLSEALEAPTVLKRLLAEETGDGLIAKLREAPPPFAVTIARGSSDHAAAYAASLIQRHLGCITASLPPSLWTRARAELQLKGALALAVSQSGEGPDVIETTAMARARGAISVAVVNRPDSPLAAAAEHVLPCHAGPETGIAATKSVLATLAVLARLVARWTEDQALQEALERLPAAVAAAQKLDWAAALVRHLGEASACFIISRGPGLPIAQEIALKLQELADLPAIALSSAEFHHGPKALLSAQHPALVLPLAPWTSGDTDLPTAEVATLGRTPGLERPAALHPDLDPILMLAAFHPALEALTLARGRDPDRPPRLTKITRTR